MGMFCETQTPNGEYRCAIEIQKIHPLGRNKFAAKVTRIFLRLLSGEQRELPVPLGDGLYEHYGETEREAEEKACAEFRTWAIEQGGRLA